jgi:hypothetical protein
LTGRFAIVRTVSEQGHDLSRAMPSDPPPEPGATPDSGSPLPTTHDLDVLEAELDRVDTELARLDATES